MPYGVAFAVTILIEVPIVLALIGPRPRWPVAAVTAVGVNAVTHPLVWLALSAAGDQYWTIFSGVELGAWLLEAAVVAAVWPPAARRLVLPTLLVANGLSCLAGLVLAATA